MSSQRKLTRSIFGLALALIAAVLSYFNLGPNDPTTNIATLIQPDKLATLGQRGANPRVQKSTYWLATAQHNGQNITNVATRAVARAGYQSDRAAILTRDALLHNFEIANAYGCLNPAGLEEMRHGKAPTVRRGPDTGDQLSVDHVIPFAVAPELDNVIANLEVMPLRRNESKNASVKERQVSKARELHQAGMLSAAGLAAVERAAR